jgi:hypothetical protein
MLRLTPCLSVVASLAFSGNAQAGHNPCKGNFNYKKPPKENFQYSSNDTEVVIHRGARPKPFEAGAFTAIDAPAHFHCEAVGGCLLIARTYIALNGGDGLTCTFVDGKPVEGRWQATQVFYPPDYSDAILMPGDHQIRTKFWGYNPGTLAQWAIDYTMYDQRAGARIRAPAPAN